MNKEYKTFEKLKEELGDKFEEFMYKANIELLDKVNQLEQANKSLRGNIKAIAKTSNNRHLEIKRLLKKLDKNVDLMAKVDQLEEENKKLNEEIKHITNEKMRLATSKNVRYTYGLR